MFSQAPELLNSTPDNALKYLDYIEKALKIEPNPLILLEKKFEILNYWYNYILNNPQEKQADFLTKLLSYFPENDFLTIERRQLKDNIQYLIDAETNNNNNNNNNNSSNFDVNRENINVENSQSSQPANTKWFSYFCCFFPWLKKHSAAHVELQDQQDHNSHSSISLTRSDSTDSD